MEVCHGELDRLESLARTVSRGLLREGDQNALQEKLSETKAVFHRLQEHGDLVGTESDHSDALWKDFDRRLSDLRGFLDSLGTDPGAGLGVDAFRAIE